MNDLFKYILDYFGVEINEEFYIVDNNGIKRKGIFRIDKYANIQCKYDDIWIEKKFLAPLIYGECKIEKKPFQPKERDSYYSYFGDDWRVCESIWINSASDYAMLIHGLIFRTKQEAECNRARCYKELTGKEWQGR